MLRPVALAINGTAPIVTWIQALALVFVACFVGALAWDTWRTVQVRRRHLEPHRAVNRLVLARACALVGALVAGGYAATPSAGSATPPSWPASGPCARGSRPSPEWRSSSPSLLLERACRLPTRRDEP